MTEVRLIDANALKYKNLAEVNGKLTYVLTAEEIDNAPTVEERPQGEWVDQDFDDLKISDYRCNQCGHYQDDISNFCPECGADMRGKEE